MIEIKKLTNLTFKTMINKAIEKIINEIINKMILQLGKEKFLALYKSDKFFEVFEIEIKKELDSACELANFWQTNQDFKSFVTNSLYKLIFNN